MHKQITWLARLRIKPDCREAFIRLTREMVAATKEEPGALIYERYLGEDADTVHVLERYIDSAAAVAHLNTFANKFGKRFGGLVEREKFVLFGEPSDELIALLEDFGAEYASTLDGFSRVDP
ncbi:MAG: antibiotic biosynthesis monooxygenase [Pseudomonadota bacterium]